MADLHSANFSRANDTFRWRMLSLNLHLKRMKSGLFAKPHVLFSLDNLVIRNGKIVWKVVWIEYY